MIFPLTDNYVKMTGGSSASGVYILHTVAI